MKSTVMRGKRIKALPFTELIKQKRPVNGLKTLILDSEEAQKSGETPAGQGAMQRSSNMQNFPVNVSVIICISLRDEHTIKSENKT